MLAFGSPLQVLGLLVIHMDSASVVVVDDSSSNPDLVFDGEWTHLFGIDSAANGTLTYTPASSSSVSFRFNGKQFHAYRIHHLRSFADRRVGTSVGVSGAMVPLNGTAPTTSVYSVDGEHTATLTSFDNITVTTYGVTFYLAQALSAGEHTLVINVTHTTGNTPYLLDYIGYIPLPSAPATSQPVGQTGSPAPSHSSKSSVPVGPIVGGVIGGVIVLASLAVGLWWLYFRRSESEEEFSYPDISAAEIIHQGEHVLHLHQFLALY